jgi:hypothetical protein
MSTFERMLQVLADRAGKALPAATVMRDGLRKNSHSGQAERQASGRHSISTPLESLEPRLAMTVDVFTTGGDWAVITSDRADDVYVQQLATVSQDLIVADNASFNSYQTIDNIDSYRTVYATNGTAVSVSGIRPTGIGDETTTRFVLARGSVSTSSTISGTISYAGSTWNFTNNGAGSTLTITPQSLSGLVSNPLHVSPISGSLQPAFVGDLAPGGRTGGDDSIFIQWSSAPATVAGVAEPSITVTYTRLGLETQSGLRPSAGTVHQFQLPVTKTNPGGIVPGTLSGRLRVSNTYLDFRTDSLFGVTADDLYFSNGSTTGVFNSNNGEGVRSSSRQVEGVVDFETGVVTLQFWTEPLPNGEGRVVQDPGVTSLDLVRYAVYNQDAVSSELSFSPGQDFSRELYVDLLTPNSTFNADSKILASPALSQISLRATNINLNAQTQTNHRLDIDASVVDRNAVVSGARGRAIADASGKITGVAIPAGMGGQGYDDDPSVAINVTVTGGGGSGWTGRAISQNGTIVGVVMITPGGGYTGSPNLMTVTIDPPTTVNADGDDRYPLLERSLAETVKVNASVAASIYDIRIADDPATSHTNRGQLFVSPTGSLSGALSESTATANTPAASVFVQADTSDLIIEGAIHGTTQSYLLRSPTAASPLTPFAFTTVAPLTGADTGLIRGGSVAVTLGNDAPTFEKQSVATNNVSLRTQIDSFRIRAATRKGVPLDGPFPYDLSIREDGSISFDAVAASGRPISLSATGNIAFTAALATAGDLSIAAGIDFTVAAPLSTSRGAVAITAANLSVNNSIRVLDPASDEARDDIILTATAGDLSLTGAVSGVNNVRLVQRNRAGVAGRIYGPSRVIGRYLNVEAEGSADIRTDVVSLSGRSVGDFSVDEIDDLSIPSLRSLGFVTIRANGTDPGAGHPLTPNFIALKASLEDISRLQVSAPRGSVDVVNNTTKTLTLGEPVTIGNGTARAMQAAGSVNIESTAGPIAVADAPVGGGSAIAVRVATTVPLLATYAQNTPGTFAATLTGNANGQLVVDGISPRVGERVLVRAQVSGRERENGVYTVTVAGSIGRPYVLTRSLDTDTSAELVSGSFIRVTEGSFRDRLFTVGYGSVFGSSPVSVTLAANRADANRARIATTTVLSASYNAGAGTISAAGALPLIDGVGLSGGDRVLVRLGTTVGGSAANGLYEVASVGGIGSTWSLRRAIDIDTGIPITTGYVATTDGSFRASKTGQAFLVDYDMLGNDAMSLTSLVAGQPSTSIVSGDINDTVTFVVASTAGTNDSAGSLGKMLKLRQVNSPSQSMAFAFASVLPAQGGSPAGVIRLTQELPVISKVFAINGANRLPLASAAGASTTPRIFIDGSRITTTRLGTPSSLATEVNGIEFVTGSQANGLSAGASLANVTLGGFAKGAAVSLSGTGGILLDSLVVGRNEAGDRLINRTGVHLKSGGNATILGSTIVGSAGAGVQTDAGSAGVTIVGTSIGFTDQSNSVGVAYAGGIGGRIGVDPLPTTAVIATAIQDSVVLTFPATVPQSALYLGQSVVGSGVQPGSVITAISGSSVTLSAPVSVSGAVNVTLGAPRRNTVGSNLTGMNLTGGSSIVTQTDVANSAYNGINITTNSHFIGISTVRNAKTNNAIFGNGGIGVRLGPGVSAFVVNGNTFGGTFQGTPAGSNRGGNVTPVNGRYKPNAKGTDIRGNLHITAAAAAKPKVAFPWRPRR